jgi:hypothetical protein
MIRGRAWSTAVVRLARSQPRIYRDAADERDKGALLPVATRRVLDGTSRRQSGCYVCVLGRKASSLRLRHDKSRGCEVHRTRVCTGGSPCLALPCLASQQVITESPGRMDSRLGKGLPWLAEGEDANIHSLHAVLEHISVARLDRVTKNDHQTVCGGGLEKQGQPPSNPFSARIDEPCLSSIVLLGQGGIKQ